MTSPTDEQRRRVRYKIADVQGWTEVVKSYINTWLQGLPPGGPIKDGPYHLRLPDWPGSLDVARGLEISNKNKFIQCLYDVFITDGIILESDNSEKRETERIAAPLLPMLVFMDATAYQWCLAWLFYKGWRWEICENPDCSGSGIVPVTTYDDNGDPIHGADNCGACSGEGGRWMKC